MPKVAPQALGRQIGVTKQVLQGLAPAPGQHPGGVDARGQLGGIELVHAGGVVQSGPDGLLDPLALHHLQGLVALPSGFQLSNPLPGRLGQLLQERFALGTAGLPPAAGLAQLVPERRNPGPRRLEKSHSVGPRHGTRSDPLLAPSQSLGLPALGPADPRLGQTLGGAGQALGQRSGQVAYGGAGRAGRPSRRGKLGGPIHHGPAGASHVVDQVRAGPKTHPSGRTGPSRQDGADDVEGGPSRLAGPAVVLARLAVLFSETLDDAADRLHFLAEHLLGAAAHHHLAQRGQRVHQPLQATQRLDGLHWVSHGGPDPFHQAARAIPDAADKVRDGVPGLARDAARDLGGRPAGLPNPLGGLPLADQVQARCGQPRAPALDGGGAFARQAHHVPGPPAHKVREALNQPRAALTETLDRPAGLAEPARDARTGLTPQALPVHPALAGQAGPVGGSGAAGRGPVFATLRRCLAGDAIPPAARHGNGIGRHSKTFAAAPASP